MDRKAFTLRLPAKLYEALSTLSGAAQRSMNDLISEAVQKFVAVESQAHARQLDEMAERLRAYRDADPDFEQAIAEFVEAEATLDDPLEAQVIDVKGPVRQQVASLLGDG